MFNKLCVAISLLVISSLNANSQEKLQPDSALVNGLQFRSIGPAMASGRISDFAVNPQNPFEYYVAVSSGHIWKTTNNGVNFSPIFDNYGVYSIGCLAIDANNPNIVWAGTGENNSQRALGYGNGVYKSIDAGKTWSNMGLKESRQVGKILIHPNNSSIIYVAAEGSVWGPGGDRGVYKSIDGGKNWIKVLEISENTGAYDLEFNPSNPDIIYATVHQRRRHAYTKINGGPESAFYKSENGGDDWRKISSGLPGGHLGRIGLAVTAANPNLVYAIVEAQSDKGGFYRSCDRGESWQRMSNYTSSGQYYTEIYVDPLDENKIYSMDTWSQISKDGGKTWAKLSTSKRHVDDHALWINPSATNHLRIGGDGGIYDSYDGGTTWTFTENLPVTQFYRVNVDNSEPFYYVYGGTQDNNTWGGPSQNTTSNGVSSDEWFITIGGDGFWVAIDPHNPNIVYSEYQYGNAYRYNRDNGELVYIRPQEQKDELRYKWNWDAPLIISPHSNTRIYMAANKVFVSENRGDSWSVISEDLTAQKDRNDFKVMGKYWSSDAVAKDVSTSQFGTIVSFAESIAKEGLLYTGSDDGVIAVSEDKGQTWTKHSTFPGIPEYCYVSDIYPSRFDENVVFATFNNLKSDDFKPYILKSNNKGKSWTAITKGLPEGTIHSITQDHKDRNMLFCGSEFGLFVSFNSGEKWIQIKNGLPDIAVRDIVIQERESDLVIATFGRGFYILHNYNALRELNTVSSDAKAHIFSIKEAKLYVPSYKRQYSFGDDFYTCANLPFGAEFTYYLPNTLETEKTKRQKKEQELFKDGAKINVNTWEDDRVEKLEEQPYLLFIVENDKGEIIRKIPSAAKKGINRIHWDLKYPDIMPVKPTTKQFKPLNEQEGGIYAMPGNYTVQLYASEKGILSPLTDKTAFKVTALNNNNFSDKNRAATLEFQTMVAELTHAIISAEQELVKAKKDIQRLKQINLQSNALSTSTNEALIKLEHENAELLLRMNGYSAKASSEEIPPSAVPLQQRLGFIIRSFASSSALVSEAQKHSAEIVKEEFGALKKDLDIHLAEIEKLKEEM